MKVGITYDLLTDWVFSKNDPVDANAEYDSAETLDLISGALQAGGHEVVRIGNVTNLMETIDSLDVDIVFNIAEGVSGRNRESQVPILLEMAGIPFVGADALTLGVTLDKVLAKKCFIADGIPTPKYFTVDSTESLSKIKRNDFPLFVKPRFEGTSKSLTEQSRVEDHASLKRQVDLIYQTYNQPAVVEQFIQGKEFTVAVLGNDKPYTSPVIQISIDGTVDLGNKFFTFAHVRAATGVDYICPANISDDLAKELQRLAIAVYKSVGCVDFGRVDFRVDDQGKPYVLEINPLPSLSKKDVFNIFPETIGTSYQRIVNDILHYALDRYGLRERQESNIKSFANNQSQVSASR